ncbi:MAG: GntR family transcriptional regulator [Treponema sp.]|jgi:LacI family transcriptional regulator|nr:GntR family transcriptional regulator [Treponema sp.]
METLNIDRTSKQPVFKQIYDILIAEMKAGLYSAGGKLPSEKELCTRFDVERNTVRKALQILVDERRIARIPGIGTRIMSPSGEGPAKIPENTEERFLSPADPQLPETDQAGRIILLITQIDYLHSAGGESFHYKLIHRFEERFSRMGYNLLFKPVGKNGTVAETIRSAMPQGIIFDSFNPDASYRESARFGLACVSVNHYTPLFTSIVSNNFDGAYQVAKRLIEAGHKKIAFILGKSSHQTNMERLSGIRTLYTALDLYLRPKYLIPSDWTFTSGTKAAEKILAMKSSDRPTAVFAFNDDLAYGCYSVLQRHGLSVPDDISIVGFDKSDRYSGMFPPISTVDVNLNAIVDYAFWYLTGCLSRQVPESCAKIQIDVAFRDNGTIRNIL